MNSQLKTKLKISTTCKHTDLLYVSATAQYLYLYKTLYHSLSICVLFEPNENTSNTISTTSTTIKQSNNNNKQTNNNYHI